MSQRFFGWSFRSSNYNMNSNDDEVKVVWVCKSYPPHAGQELAYFYIVDETNPTDPRQRRTQQTEHLQAKKEAADLGWDEDLGAAVLHCSAWVEVKRQPVSHWRPCPRPISYMNEWSYFELQHHCRYHQLRFILTPLFIGGQWCDEWTTEWGRLVRAEYYDSLQSKAAAKVAKARKVSKATQTVAD